MTKTLLVSVMTLATALGFSAPTFAQDMQHMIGGNAVPAAQVEAVQAKCDELRATGSADSAATTDTTTETDAAAGTATDATTDATGTAASTGTDAAASPGAEVEVDLETLTIEMCDEGGFTASAM